jgi:TolA-binding protein
MSTFDLSRLASKWSSTTEGPPFDEERSRRRFAQAVRERAMRSGRPRRLPLWSVAAAAALLLILGGLGVWSLMPASPEPIAFKPGAWLETHSSEQLPLRFAEGTKVVVHPTSKVHVESVDPRGARMEVERGSATEVFEVRVARGSVAVTGPLLQGERIVRGGERCSVALRQRRLEVTQREAKHSAEEVPHLEVHDLPVLDAPSSSDTLGGSPLHWLELEHLGRYAEAVARAEAEGLDRIYSGGSAAELMSLARAARLANRSTIAGHALMRVRQRFPRSRQAATAAFLLGRQAAPSAAAQWFTTYLQEAPSGPLAREAAGRLVESYQRAGNFAQAQLAAQSYLRQYPSGPHAAFARSVLTTK